MELKQQIIKFKMQIKIITNNLWRYYEWENRKEKVIEFLKSEDADIVLFQEAAYDGRLKEKYENQIHELNKELKYTDYFFGKIYKMVRWHKEPIDWEMYMGLGILSKYPIKHTQIVSLPPIKQERKFGFLHVVLETKKGDIDIINVHFENTNEGAKEHLKETIKWCRKKNIKPIIAGDFNMKVINDLIEEADKDYFISYLVNPYKSFYPTEFSNDKIPITLDYILLHKLKFKFLNIECSEANISDHKPIIAEIIIKD